MALSPENNTIEFKERIEKEVEIRLDLSLAYINFPKYHVSTVWKKLISFYSKEYGQSHEVVRKILSIYSFLY